MRSEDAGNADTMVSDLGPTGVPFINVKNGCATGGSSLVSAFQALRGGGYDVGLVVGFDKHPRGAFVNKPSDWSLPDWYGEVGPMITTQFFGAKLQRYMHDHGIPVETLAQVAEKAFANGSITPHAWRRRPLSADEILASPMSPTRSRSTCSARPARRRSSSAAGNTATLESPRPVRLRSASSGRACRARSRSFSPSLGPTDRPTTTARQAFEAGLGPGDVDVAQVQDTESGAELIHLAEVGCASTASSRSCGAGGATRIDGRLPVNTDSGALANGEPVGASGLRQVYEVVTQLRGEAGERQVPKPKVGFTQVYGVPGVSACTVVSR